MGDSEDTPEEKVPSFGLDNSNLQTHLHQFVGFSPRFQRQLAAAAEPLAGKSSRSHSVLEHAADPQEEAEPAEPSKTNRRPLASSDKEDTDESSDDPIARSIYGGLYGKKTLSKKMRRTVEKGRKTKAENQRKGARKDEKEITKRGRAGARAKGNTKRSGVKLEKGKSYDGVTKHVTLKADRKKYGKSAQAAKNRESERSPGEKQKECRGDKDREDKNVGSALLQRPPAGSRRCVRTDPMVLI